MRLETSARHLYEPILGIVLFAMRDQSNVVHCMVSEYALRHRALADSVDEEGVETLFRLYRGEVEALASQQYESGSMNPIVRAFELAAPPAP